MDRNKVKTKIQKKLAVNEAFQMAVLVVRMDIMKDEQKTVYLSIYNCFAKSPTNPWLSKRLLVSFVQGRVKNILDMEP